MTLRSHPCAATGCQHEVAMHLLMCMDDWRMVPVALRRAVLATNRERINAGSIVTVHRYREAVASAVAALAAKQLKKNDDRAAVVGDLFAQPLPTLHSQLLKEDHGNPTTTPGREPFEGGGGGTQREGGLC